jgi:hypothetical protein
VVGFLGSVVDDIYTIKTLLIISMAVSKASYPGALLWVASLICMRLHVVLPSTHLVWRYIWRGHLSLKGFLKSNTLIISFCYLLVGACLFGKTGVVIFPPTKVQFPLVHVNPSWAVMSVQAGWMC